MKKGDSNIIYRHNLLSFINSISEDGTASTSRKEEGILPIDHCQKQESDLLLYFHEIRETQEINISNITMLTNPYRTVVVVHVDIICRFLSLDIRSEQSLFCLHFIISTLLRQLTFFFTLILKKIILMKTSNMQRRISVFGYN